MSPTVEPANRKKRPPQGIFELPNEILEQIAARCATTETLGEIAKWLEDEYQYRTSQGSLSRFWKSWTKRALSKEVVEDKRHGSRILALREIMEAVDRIQANAGESASEESVNLKAAAFDEIAATLREWRNSDDLTSA